MEKAVQRKLPGEHVVQRLHIHDHVGGAEGQKADLARYRSVQCGTGAEMERRDGHSWF